jgi:hypothetical protein
MTGRYSTRAIPMGCKRTVDSVQLIYGIIPKKFFKQNPEYWAAK